MPDGHSRLDAIKILARDRLRELREAGLDHAQIAERFGLTVPRVHQLCHDLLGEPDPEQWSWDAPVRPARRPRTRRRSG